MMAFQRQHLLTLLIVLLSTIRPAMQSEFNLNVDSAGGVSIGQEHLDLSDTHDLSLLLSSMGELCDFYNTCNVSHHLPDHVQGLLGCCVPCDCSDECYAVGNCCGDKETLYENLESYYSYDLYLSGTLVTKSCEITSSSDESVNIHRHMLVSECWPGYMGVTRVHCSALRSLDQPAESVLPVYSKTNNVSYANIYCAMCNFEEDSDALVPWLAYIECDDHAALTQLRRRAYAGLPLQDGCQFKSESPFFSKPCYTLNGPIDCSGTKFETLCASDPKRYAIYREMEARIFAGKCNLAPPSTAVNPNRQFLDQKNHSTLVDIVDLGIGPFAEDRSNGTTSEGGEDVGCAKGEVRSRDGKHCLHVTCSPSQIDVGENGDRKCIDVFGPVKGACLDYRLVVDTPIVFYDHNSTLVVKDYALSDRLVFSSTTDTELMAINNDTVTYELRLIGQSLYNYIDIPELYKTIPHDLEHTLIRYPMNATLKRTDVSFKPQRFDENGYLAYSKDPEEFDCDKAIALHDIQFCEMVVFPEIEYRIEDGNVLALTDGLKFQSHEYFLKESRDGTMHAHVCLDSYFSSEENADVMAYSGSDLSCDVIGLHSLICTMLAFILL